MATQCQQEASELAKEIEALIRRARSIAREYGDGVFQRAAEDMERVRQSLIRRAG